MHNDLAALASQTKRSMKRETLLRNPLVRMSFATACVALATALRVRPLHAHKSAVPWVTFYPAVVAAAVLGGMWAGILATFLACGMVVFFWPLFSLTPSIWTNGRWIGMIVFVIAGMIISALCERLRRAQARVRVYERLISSIDEGFCVVEMICDSGGQSIDYRFVECNPAFEKQTGLIAARGKTIRQMVPGHETHWFEIYGNVARTGEEIRFENSAAAMQKYFDVFAFRAGGQGSSRVGILFNDISERKRREKELLDAALHDKLTGLPNRTMFRGYLSKAITRAERSGQALALLFLDLDDFKAVNDTFGHEAGDLLLQAVTQRLLSCVRTGDLVSRIGGDEFTIILESCLPEALPVLAARFIEIVGKPVDLDRKTAQISASIGIVTYPSGGDDVEALIQRADATMYNVKRNQKKGYRVWDPSITGVRE